MPSINIKARFTYLNIVAARLSLNQSLHLKGHRHWKADGSLVPNSRLKCRDIATILHYTSNVLLQRGIWHIFCF
jgi:hypothetical protein